MQTAAWHNMLTLVGPTSGQNPEKTMINHFISKFGQQKS